MRNVMLLLTFVLLKDYIEGEKNARMLENIIGQIESRNLTQQQARIIEQSLINQYGLQKKGGLLFNKINSISPKWWDQYGIK